MCVHVWSYIHFCSCQNWPSARRFLPRASTPPRFSISCFFVNFVSCEQQIAGELRSTQRRAETNVLTLKFFWDEFGTILEQAGRVGVASSVHLTVAVRGLGTFAGAIAQHLGAGRLQEMTAGLLRLCDSMLTGSREEMQTAARFVPAFITAFARISEHLSSLDPALFSGLQRLFAALFMIYPYEPRGRWRHEVTDALTHLHFSLHSRGSLRSFLATALVAALALTASVSGTGGPATMFAAAYDTDPVTGVDGGADGAGQRAVWPEYIPLWQAILQAELPKGADLEMSVRQPAVQADIYAGLCDALLTVVAKLDVTLLDEESTEEKMNSAAAAAAADQVMGAAGATAGDVSVTRKPKDMFLFSNTTAFVHELWKKAEADLLAPFVLELFIAALGKTAVNNHCAPLYRLQADLVRVATRSGLFADEGVVFKATIVHKKHGVPVVKTAPVCLLHSLRSVSCCSRPVYLCLFALLISYLFSHFLFTWCCVSSVQTAGVPPETRKELAVLVRRAISDTAVRVFSTGPLRPPVRGWFWLLRLISFLRLSWWGRCGQLCVSVLRAFCCCIDYCLMVV